MRIIVIFLLAITFANSAFAAVYTTKQRAESLALILDKGRFEGFLIRTTFVLNDKNGFYVAVTLSNGKTYRWYMDDVHRHYRDNKLTLRGNKAIIFTEAKDLSKFVIFDKNDFHRVALNGEVYKRNYEEGDLLEGLTLFYKIKEFYFLNPKKIRAGKDKKGFINIYRLDLINGDVHYFSVDEAYQIYLNQQILRTAQLDIKPLGKPYQIISMQPHEKPTDRRGVNEFGVELGFDLTEHEDNEINVQENQFPVIVYEQNFPGKNGVNNKFFLVDVLLPSMIFTPNKDFNIGGIEYLENLKLVKSSDKNVSILRGKFNNVNYNFFEIPPSVTKSEDNRIFITFFHNLDQTLPDFDSDNVDNPNESASTVAAAIPIVPEPSPFKPNTPFGRAFKKAIDFLSVVEIETLAALEKIRKYEEAVLLFEKAGYLAATDAEFIKALDARNRTRSRIFHAGVEYAERALDNPKVNKAQVKQELVNLEIYTQSPRESKHLKKLINDIK